MVLEHDKLEQRHDTLNDMFWLMTFLEAATHIGSQVIGNFFIGSGTNQNMVAPYSATVLLAIASIIYAAQRSEEAPRTSTFKHYRHSLWTYILADKRIWLLSWSQACVHFSVAVFWILWAPTIVADGREVQLGFMYPCLLGAKMLGSTAFPWFLNGSLTLRTEDCLLYVFCLMGVILSAVAYDYQDIGVLVVLFCLFHASVGLVLPSLAKLRSMYVPNEFRGGMMSLSQAPANIIFFFFLVQGGYYRNMENSTIIALSAVSLISAAGCMYILKQSGKQQHHNWHKL